MSTLLTNRKMAPSLRARIETSVGVRKTGVLFRALMRLGITLSILTAIVSVISQRRGGERALERQRSALLAELHRQHASFGAPEQKIGKIERALLGLVASYDGDVTGRDLAKTASMVYVRGPLDGLNTPDAVRKTALGSSKDAFAACWIDPPRSRSEGRILSKVKAAYAGGVGMPNVHRLGDAFAALKVLEPAWEARVRAGRDEHDLTVLQNELRRTPFDEGKQALDSELLLAVVDEPGDMASPAELDGERPHDVRVLLVNLKTAEVLLRARKHVDPAAWSQNARSEWASGLDSCALAYDLTSG